MRANDFFSMIRRCAGEAHEHAPGCADARAHAFITELAGSLQHHDIVGATLVSGLLASAPVGGPE